MVLDLSALTVREIKVVSISQSCKPKLPEIISIDTANVFERKCWRVSIRQ